MLGNGFEYLYYAIINLYYIVPAVLLSDDIFIDIETCTCKYVFSFSVSLCNLVYKYAYLKNESTGS